MKNIEKYEKELKALGTYFKVTREGLPKKCAGECKYCVFNGSGCTIKRIEWLLEEYKEPILTDKEKVIIKNIIKAFEPFGKELSYITKERWYCDENCCYLNFKYGNDNFGTLTFNQDKLFKGMKKKKVYTPEELGL